MKDLLRHRKSVEVGAVPEGGGCVVVFGLFYEVAYPTTGGAGGGGKSGGKSGGGGLKGPGGGSKNRLDEAEDQKVEINCFVCLLVSMPLKRLGYYNSSK